MTEVQVWSAIARLADAWRATSAVARFASDLPRNADQRSEGLPGLLQEISASASIVTQHPLLAASKLRWVAGQLPGVDWDALTKYPDWLEAAGRVEFATRLTVAWARSRLPGYPRLLTPELVPNGPLATAEFSFDVAWQRRDRELGLQFRNPPPEICKALDAEDSLRSSIEAATRALASGLRSTEEWNCLTDARESLNEGDRGQLAAARKEARRRLEPAEVDAYEPDIAIRRAEYRRGVVDEVIASMSGQASTFATAFSAANQLLDRAAVDVLGQLTCFKMPTLATFEAELFPGPPRAVRFRASDNDAESVFLQPGTLAWLDDSLVSDAVIVTRTQFQWDGTGSSTSTFDADVLPGTARAWRTTLSPDTSN